VGRNEALARIEATVAKAVDPHDEEKFFDWVDMYHDRLASVTGVAIDTLDGGGCDEVSEEHYDVLWRLYFSGADAVEAADEDLKNWPPEQRVSTQSADDFRKEWHEAKDQVEEFWKNKKPPPG
jgi:hypothetical protein